MEQLEDLQVYIFNRIKPMNVPQRKNQTHYEKHVLHLKQRPNIALNGEDYINLTKKVVECINLNVFPSLDD